MNDRAPGVGDSIRRFRDPQRAGEMLVLLGAGLYSGFDGDVGAGWIPLLDRLAADLVALGWDRDLRQVKEKFGTLRFHVGERTDAMRDRIAEAEEESARLCEDCGRPGRLVTLPRGWVRTLCRRCHARGVA